MKIGVLLLLGTAALVMPSACASTSNSSSGTAESSNGTTKPSIGIYDPSGKTQTRLVTSDFVRKSARALNVTDRTSILRFRLTKAGVLKFNDLTRNLARRGVRVHRLQPFAFEINGRVYARPRIDYRTFPDGLDASSGLQIAGLGPAIARRLAAEIRGG